MRILGIDLEIGNPFETEAGDRWPEDQAWITEIGLVLYDTDFGSQPVESFECLVNEGKGVSEDAEEYTGISTELIEKYGKHPSFVAPRALEMLEACDYVVAHNGNKADKPWLKAFLLRYLGKEGLADFHPPHWIDSMIDVEYPNNCRAKNLTYLQAFHGFANPFPHRAGSDVLTMMKIFFQYDLERVIEVSKSPQVTLSALAPVDMAAKEKRGLYFKAGTPEYKEMEDWKKAVKKAGFRWDGDAEVTGAKRWYKFSKELWIDEGKESHPFETIRLEEK